jgi:uncharacterized protein
MEKIEISEVDLFITEECNLNCKYCYAPKSNNTLTLEQGKKIIDKVKEKCPDKLQLSFWGGEPLLYPELVVDLITYAKDLYSGKMFDTLIVTNGTFYDNEIFKKLKRLGTRIQVSLDGKPETNEEVRGKSELVIGNLKKMLVNFPNMSVRMTYLPDNVHKLADNVLFIRSLGVKRVMHQAAIEAEWDEQSVNIYAKQLENLYKMWVNNPKKSGVMFLEKNYDIFCGTFPMTEAYCGAGRSLIAILPNGDVYPCHRAASNKLFKLGNILEGEIIRGSFLSLTKNNENCGSCKALPFCHTCVITHQQVNSSTTEPVQPYCRLQFVETALAEKYGAIRKQISKDKMLDSMATVIADMSDQLAEMNIKLNMLMDKAGIGNVPEPKV